MNGHLARWVALGVAAGVLGACNPAPQRSTTGAASGAPVLTQPGGGYEMDHQRMGGSRGVGGGTPSVSPTGGGMGGAEFAHPGGVSGTGRAR